MLIRYGGQDPELEEPCFVAPGAQLVGRVHLSAYASVWFNAVLRGDEAPIWIGARSNLQDGVVVHADADGRVVVGEEVTVGHRAILHGCEVGSGALVGMGAIVLNGAVVGEESLIGAGALVPEGRVIPPGSLVLGVPGRIVRTLTAEERARIRQSATRYIHLWQDGRWQS
jgi:carbonic anhydrase/acetyltransferase-like protein (isoleucine patch superfamily)